MISWMFSTLSHLPMFSVTVLRYFLTMPVRFWWWFTVWPNLLIQNSVQWPRNCAVYRQFIFHVQGLIATLNQFSNRISFLRPRGSIRRQKLSFWVIAINLYTLFFCNNMFDKNFETETCEIFRMNPRRRFWKEFNFFV